MRVHIRGNHKNLGEVAPRRFLQIVAGEKQAAVSEGSGRLQLAEWMVRPENPLTARVMVNRIWKHHFGQGIVRSVDNFGKTGDSPTHPELLDFLAQRFIESGWSVKAMHRMMVLSSTYAMSSQPEPEAEKLDPENKLLHRMPVQRLEAESIRDAILAVAGSLRFEDAGPERSSTHQRLSGRTWKARVRSFGWQRAEKYLHPGAAQFPDADVYGIRLSVADFCHRPAQRFDRAVTGTHADEQRICRAPGGSLGATVASA